MIDEGYTKFTVIWTKRNPVDHPAIAELEQWRQPLFDAGLIGHYPDLDIGYGNLSRRIAADGLFIISGTQTGHLPRTGNSHYSRVIEANIVKNSVTCEGATQASSETLTHAAIYELDLSINAVVHVHSTILWQRLRSKAPTTRAEISYGTPEMAGEFERLYRETSFPDTGVAVMAGHEAGLVSIGGSMQEAASRILVLHSEH